MSLAKKCKVEVKKDHLSKIASGSPEFALAEMIWNSLDADSTDIDVRFHEDTFGVDKITIKDNGSGINYNDAESLFVSLGGSWKAFKQKTYNGRFLHGKDGEGRFKAFVLGRTIDWNVIYKRDNKYFKYSIEGNSDYLDEFALSDEQLSSVNKTGVEVVITEISKKFHVLDRDKAIEKLTPIFALYLSNYPNINLSINGIRIIPDNVINRKENIPLGFVIYGGDKYSVDLLIVEWKSVSDKEIWFCDEKGFPLELYNKQIRGTGDFGYSGYLRSDYFRKQHDANLLALGDLNKDLQHICDKAVKEIKNYFLKRSLENASEQINKWKDEKIYPYVTEPETPIEVAERQVFDIVAININQNLPSFDETDKKSKAFQLRMLRQAIEKSPEELQLIISEVLHLPKQKQEQLADILKNTSLVSIISASKLVTDRFKFLAGLEHLLFDDDIKPHVKERSQLHRILAENTWLFGHAFSLSVDDKSLTDVLRKHAKLAKLDVPIDEPVKRVDGKKGIIDLMLSRSIPRNHSNELEHLIVELKAPKVDIGEKEIQQIKSYAFAVAKDERFKGLDTRWHFWIISNDLDEYAEIELSQEKYEEGVIFRSTKPIDLTIWVKTWSQLLQENKHRLEFIKDKLNYKVDKEDALAYIRKTYEEFTHGLISSDEDITEEST